MKKIKILITAAGGDIGSNIINILREQKNENIEIIATDINDVIFNLKAVDKFYKVPKATDSKYLEKITSIINKDLIDIVIPLSENEISIFIQNQTIINQLNIKVLINNKNIINGFLNKHETSILLNKLEVKTPRTYLFTEYKEQLNFPIILKSKMSIYSKSIYLVKNQEQLRYLKCSLTNLEEYIVQEYIGSIDEEYTTTVYKYNNKLEVISFKRKLTGGMTSYASIVNEEKLIKYAKKIANKFNLEGTLNIQSRKQGNEFYIFEINPRFSSTVYIRNNFGFQDLLWWINNICGNDIFNLKDVSIDLKGSAILGYQYRFLKGEINE